MLSYQEHSFFEQAKGTLAVNEFASDEGMTVKSWILYAEDSADRSLFLGSMFEEFKDKELKLAVSPEFSSFMEDIIRAASVDQLQTTVHAFDNQ